MLLLVVWHFVTALKIKCLHVIFAASPSEGYGVIIVYCRQMPCQDMNGCVLHHRSHRETSMRTTLVRIWSVLQQRIAAVGSTDVLWSFCWPVQACVAGHIATEKRVCAEVYNLQIEPSVCAEQPPLTAGVYPYAPRAVIGGMACISVL